MQAIILAAGMGKRLGELTQKNTKCMVKVNGIPLIERMLTQLNKFKLSKIIIVIGYEGKKLIDFIDSFYKGIPIQYIENPIYDKTNNIYSLFLARQYLLEEDTLLLESDLIFEDNILNRLIEDSYPNLALVAKYEHWMDGTVVTLDDENNIVSFISKKFFKYEDLKNYYKTVNIYKFSKEFSSTHYVPFLEAYIKAIGNNEYYEQVLRVITLLEKPEIKALRLEGEKWYEIDDIQDLDIAESVFADDETQLKLFQNRYGGYWRFPKLIDFCYLVNPFFPNKRLINELKANFETLLTQYPSGMAVNSLIAGKYFSINPKHLAVGNGAAELIKSLIEFLPGKMGVVFPTFEEYPNRKNTEEIIPFVPQNENFSYSENDLIDFYSDKAIDILVLVNPDNPSGNFIPIKDVKKLLIWSKDKNIKLIIDESFIDFTDESFNNSLINSEILNNFTNLIVVKSISKSYGVPGLRLGVIASSDFELIQKIRKNVSIWNINSFGEFYMQIFNKYENDYREACNLFIEERKRFYIELCKIKYLKVIPSQANYFLCKVLPPFNAKLLTQKLLKEAEILIKDCSFKKGFNSKEYVRISIRSKEDNNQLIQILKEFNNEINYR
ncbi:MAG TPA: aminotransferase class I/II-fold pyridoxal phosphate-dependent enzyme [Ignavibacteriales bacterium]|nr:aminotransferase class I/II-fold pyridoxal phosphate-dependent enzyme [Ignavibacteriales bacterium]